MEINSNKNSS